MKEGNFSSSTSLRTFRVFELKWSCFSETKNSRIPNFLGIDSISDFRDLNGKWLSIWGIPGIPEFRISQNCRSSSSRKIGNLRGSPISIIDDLSPGTWSFCDKKKMSRARLPVTPAEEAFSLQRLSISQATRRSEWNRAPTRCFLPFIVRITFQLLARFCALPS